MNFRKTRADFHMAKNLYFSSRIKRKVCQRNIKKENLEDKAFRVNSGGITRVHRQGDDSRRAQLTGMLNADAPSTYLG